MKDGWEVWPLGDVCDLSIGRTPSRSDPTLWDADRQTRNVWVSIADLGNAEAGIVSDSREYVSDKGAALGRVVPAGTLLLSFKLSLGKLAFAGCDLQTNEAIAALPIRKGVALLDRFLFWYLQSVAWESVAGADSKVKGKTLNKKTLGALPVPIPPLAEQERIVRILDKALGNVNAVRIGASTTSSLAANLPDSYVRQLLVSRGSSWPQRAVDDIAERCLGKMLDKSKNRGDLKPYLRNQNVRWFGFDLEDVLTMRFLPEERERYTARKGDVLVCEGGYPGRAAVWEGEDPVYFQKAVHRVRFEDPEMAEWFVNYLHFCDNDGLLRRHFTGTGIQHFTGKALGAFPVPTPPTHELGHLIADMRDMRRSTEELALAHSRKIEACDALRASLLNEAFRGQL